MTSAKRNHRRPVRCGGFTLVELLVVIGIIALLISILLPSLGRAREQAKKSVCLNNLRAAGQALNIYANANQGKLPCAPGATTWLWDLPTETRDLILQAGMVRQSFYCPSGDVQDADDLWDYSGGFSVVGYFWLTWRVNASGAQTGPALISSTAAPAYETAYQKSVIVKNAAEIEIVTDATLSTGGNFAGVKGGWSGIHRSNHLRASNPMKAEGGNVLFLDGHAQWRTFDDMRLRCQPGHDEWF